MLAFIRTSDILFITVFVALLYSIFSGSRKRVRTTRLRGPKPPSYWSGWSRTIIASKDAAPLYAAWSEEFGSAFFVNMAMGRERVVLFDPQAIAHFYSNETVVYHLSKFARRFIANLLGKGIIWSDGNDHKRQRKILAPAFSPQAIKDITAVFFDSAYKAKEAWDAILDATVEKEVVIDVQQWMNSISLDTIGIAGFSHDFQSLAGVHSPVEVAFNSIGKSPGGSGGLISIITPVVAQVFPSILPLLMKIPNKRSELINSMSKTIGEIGNQLLAQSKIEMAGLEKQSDRSLIGTLVRAESSNPQNSLSQVEMEAQMKTLIFAGYETSSISLTWILMELARFPDKQTRLRKELQQFGTDLSYDQLWNPSVAPYLDAVVKESLRIHAPVAETTRIAGRDDIVPLMTPATTFTGEKVTSITIAAGTLVTVPITAVNRSKVVWGPDAEDFRPERWLTTESTIPALAKELQGFHHLLTFIDGPRTCLGKGFAVTEIKAVISVLLRHYSFAPRDGPDTRYAIERTVLPRPKIDGEATGVLPLRVMRVD